MNSNSMVKDDGTDSDFELYQEIDIDYVRKILENEEEFFKQMRGCVLGAFIGDACGTSLQFMKSPIPEAAILKAISMSGGGHFTVAEGQVTDDSEMALKLAESLCRMIQTGSRIDFNKIALGYLEWFQSRPFDIGNTIMNSLKYLSDSQCDDIEAAGTMSFGSFQMNSSSESNGSLMRITPLAIFTSFFQFNASKQIIETQCQLTHPNPKIKRANLFYCFLIKNLLILPREVALQKTIQAFQDDVFLKEWIEEGYQRRDLFNSTSIGHAKIAFVNSIHCLKQGYTFEESMRKIFFLGGDTDTNAAIVLGVIGCSVGDNNIKKNLIDQLLRFNPSSQKNYRQRPIEYSPNKINIFFNAIGQFLETIKLNFSLKQVLIQKNLEYEKKLNFKKSYEEEIFNFQQVAPSKEESKSNQDNQKQIQNFIDISYQNKKTSRKALQIVQFQEDENDNENEQTMHSTEDILKSLVQEQIQQNHDFGNDNQLMNQFDAFYGSIAILCYFYQVLEEQTSNLMDLNTLFKEIFEISYSKRLPNPSNHLLFKICYLIYSKNKPNETDQKYLTQKFQEHFQFMIISRIQFEELYEEDLITQIFQMIQFGQIQQEISTVTAFFSKCESFKKSEPRPQNKNQQQDFMLIGGALFGFSRLRRILLSKDHKFGDKMEAIIKIHQKYLQMNEL